MSNLPRIAVSMGDPAGVGPELCLRLLCDSSILAQCVPVIYGDAALLSRASDACGVAMPGETVAPADVGDNAHGPTIADVGALTDAGSVEPGRIDSTCGRAAYACIEAAANAAISGQVSALVTCPVNKESMREAGIPHPGHTEILAAMTNTSRFCMMLTCSELTVSLVTTHVGLDDVPGGVSTARIRDVTEMTADVMTRIHGRPAKLAVCGLNPHAGEHGLLGRGEEEKTIGPAIEQLREAGLDVVGPLPPDTAFLPERRKETDAFVCMYHDQGLIPLKMLGFNSAVNVTLGLPIVRTSPGHGTAFDIAWKGEARPDSLIQAVLLAVQLSG